MTGRTAAIGALVTAGLAIALSAGSVRAATVNGTPRNDTLRGGAGADMIYGRAGKDRLYGGPGNDVLVGGPGNDVLVGGVGADTLRCGPGRDTATRDVSDKVALDCEVVRGPKPVPPPPPSPSPPPTPPTPPFVDAPATFVLGAGVTAEQQAGIKRGLDIGATYFRSGLGRDLPPITVYVDDDLDGIVNLYAQTYPTSIERSRQNWQTATAVAAPRRTWVYTGSTSWRPDSGQKIMVHEAFHIMQYELAGSRALDGGPDVVPSVGPQWLTEGTAEYVGYGGIASAALIPMSQIRDQWIRRTKLTASPLRSRETSRGLFGEPEPYQISPLAVDFLLATRSDRLLVAYYEAIGRGEVWQSAFASVFGKSVETFYAEFETYRSGL